VRSSAIDFGTSTGRDREATQQQMRSSTGRACGGNLGHCDVLAGLVCDEAGEAVAVGLCEGELGSGMGGGHHDDQARSLGQPGSSTASVGSVTQARCRSS
jgi:hypothetical protein